jgi:hypothetical protein
MSSRSTSRVPKEDVVFPRMLYCDSRCSQTLTGLSLALPGALLCNANRRLGDRQHVILRQRVRGSVRAVRAVRNTRVFQTETRVVADEALVRLPRVSGRIACGFWTDLHFADVLAYQLSTTGSVCQSNLQLDVSC